MTNIIIYMLVEVYQRITTTTNIMYKNINIQYVCIWTSVSWGIQVYHQNIVLLNAEKHIFQLKNHPSLMKLYII